MITSEERTRGVTLTLVDFTTVFATLREKAAIPADHDVSFGFDPWALGYAKDGTPILVCNEGVGYTVDDDGVELGVYVASPGHMAMLPKYLVTLTREDIESLPQGPEVDLADHVRRFGSRLESNFRQLHRALS